MSTESGWGGHVSLLTALVTASILALFGFPFRFYQCWFSFSRLGTGIGTLLYLVLAGGGGGLLGWGLALLSQARPTPSELLNGVLYGISGGLVLRADFRAGSRPAAGPRDQFRDARSALTSSINWTADQLDEITYRKAETWLSMMPDGDLLDEAWRIQAHIATQSSRRVTDKAKNEMFDKLVPAMEQVRVPADRKAGRAHLITFCATYYRSEHLPRSVRVPGPPKVSDSEATRPG